jgi:hypothetical protein
MKTSGATSHAARMTRVPAWAFDDDKIKKYILTRFPNVSTNPEHRRLASRMIRLIHLYYRVGATLLTVSEELKISLPMVKKLIHKLNKTMASPLKPHGRPRKGVSLDGTSGEVVQRKGEND